MKKALAIGLAAVALTLALPASAQFRKPEDAVKYRQSVMTLQGHHVGRIFAMANGRIPFDAKTAADDAELLNQVSRLPWVAFIEGTDKVGNSSAKPEIWKEKAKFDQTASKLQEDVAKLNAAAKTGNLDQIKAAVGTVGQTCKSCHDSFQKQP
jgi:cytochrome c556